PVHRRLTFAAGDVAKRVAVTVHGDRLPEGDELFTVRLFPVDDVEIAVREASGIIEEDDVEAPPLEIAIQGGDHQTGPPGQPLLDPLVVQVTAGDAAVRGVPVSWQVVRGQAQLAPVETSTGSDGFASSQVTLG